MDGLEASLDEMKVQTETSLDEMKVQGAASRAAVKISLGKAMARRDSLGTWITALMMQHRMNCGGLVKKQDF